VLTSAEGGTNAKFWEHLTHFSALNYSMSLNMTHVNLDEWNDLTEEQQAAVMTAAEAASDAAWGALGDRVAQNYADMQANGITVVDPVPADFLATLNAAGQSVYADWLDKVGPVGQEILDAYAAKKSM
jgi:TRAP-type C4-dicarboxylate transport system substrate-binding protein